MKASAIEAFNNLKRLAGHSQGMIQQTPETPKELPRAMVAESPGSAQRSPAAVIPSTSGRRMSTKVRALQSRAAEAVTDEKLTPVVEERLLVAVFDKYKAEASGFMPLSRLIRFSKEFGIIAGGQCAQLSPLLVAGDIDVLYKVSLLVKTDSGEASLYAFC